MGTKITNDMMRKAEELARVPSKPCRFITGRMGPALPGAVYRTDFSVKVLILEVRADGILTVAPMSNRVNPAKGDVYLDSSAFPGGSVVLKGTVLIHLKDLPESLGSFCTEDFNYITSALSDPEHQEDRRFHTHCNDKGMREVIADKLSVVTSYK